MVRETKIKPASWMEFYLLWSGWKWHKIKWLTSTSFAHGTADNVSKNKYCKQTRRVISGAEVMKMTSNARIDWAKDKIPHLNSAMICQSKHSKEKFLRLEYHCQEKHCIWIRNPTFIDTYDNCTFGINQGSNNALSMEETGEGHFEFELFKGGWGGMNSM